MNLHLTPRERVELKRDVAVFAAALASTGVVTALVHGTADRASVVAALVVAAKVTARVVFQHAAEAVDQAAQPAVDAPIKVDPAAADAGTAGIGGGEA